MKIADVIMYLLVGGTFAGYGVVALFRKKTRIGFGGGRAGGAPLFHITLDGAPAAVFGIFCIVGGCLFGFPSFYQILSGKELYGFWTFWMPFAGIAIMIFAAIFGALIQAAVSVGESIREQRESQLKQNQTDDQD